MIEIAGRRGFTPALVLVAVLFLAVPLLPAGCGGGGGDTAEVVLLDTSVSVAADGGSATVYFQGASGQTIKITLTGPSETEPYGYLETPGGTGSYTPPNAGQSGTNEAEITLTETGQFSLTVFDGTNRGGTITVTVTVLP